jgi:kinesin family member 6/9
MSVPQSKPVFVYARCRPHNPDTASVTVDLETSSISVDAEKQASFSFDRVFGPLATQDDIFGIVGRPHVTDAMRGLNGTIFAYGQTGSGKTFTLTGGIEDYSQRGLIPRIISSLFSQTTASEWSRSKVRWTRFDSYFFLDINIILGDIQ